MQLGKECILVLHHHYHLILGMEDLVDFGLDLEVDLVVDFVDHFDFEEMMHHSIVQATWVEQMIFPSAGIREFAIGVVTIARVKLTIKATYIARGPKLLFQIPC